MDFCCYGANICRWFLGLPEKVVALGGTYVRDYLTVEDNAILLMGYKKAMGIAEASWSQIGRGGPMYPFVINGSEGAIVVGADLNIYTIEKKKWEKVEPPTLEEGSRNGPEHFVTCILKEKPFESSVSPLYNLHAQAILEAGLISMRDNRAVCLEEIKIME